MNIFKKNIIFLMAALFLCHRSYGALGVITLTPNEQALRLKVIAATPRQKEWLRTSLNGRIYLAEELGEQGARNLALSQGWKPIYDGTTPGGLIQGLDQVYESIDGVIHVVEAKGGTSQLGVGYGYKQGTSEWAVKAAENTLSRSGATAEEQKAAKMVLDAAETGKLRIHTYQTPHLLGEPQPTIEKQIVETSEQATKLARDAQIRIAQRGAKSMSGRSIENEMLAMGEFTLVKNASTSTLEKTGELMTAEEAAGLGPEDPIADIAAGVTLVAGVGYAGYEWVFPSATQTTITAENFYTHLDDQQKNAFETYIYRQHGLTPLADVVRPNP